MLDSPGWPALAVLTLVFTASACVRGSFFEFRADEQCWDWDPSPPPGVDLSVCRWSDDGIRLAIDPDGDCWQMPSCGVDAWAGWRTAELGRDDWCIEASSSSAWLPECD